MALGTKTRGAVTLTRTYSTRAVGRKRVLNDGPRELDQVDAAADAGLLWCERKKRSPAPAVEDPCYIALLPQDLLVRILCGVHHSDLDQLMLVSKAVRDAALVAKRIHFAFSTPLCKPAFSRLVLDNDEDADGVHDDDSADDHVPNAPRRSRKCESKIHGKRIDSLAVALFAGETDDDGEDDSNHFSSGTMLIDF